MHRILSVNNYEVSLSIGCLPEEHERLQVVSFSISICLPTEQVGESSDNLEGVICYAELCEEVDRIAQKRHYNLIENLAAITFAAVKKKIPADASLTLTLQKVTPPVVGLRGGASYTISEISQGA
jgi:FolB domain-containing protein